MHLRFPIFYHEHLHCIDSCDKWICVQVMAGAIIGVVVGCLFPQPSVLNMAA